MSVTVDFRGGASGIRMDESAVRLLFVEHSADYAALVCETLDRAPKGHFEVCHTNRLDAAAKDIETGEYDALLLDLTANQAGGDTIEAAAHLASRVPVIVLRGAESDSSLNGGAAQSHDEALVRDRIAHSDLPVAILSAVRRSRRLGQVGAAEPIVLRDPLRALARAFAKLRSLAG